MEENDAEKWNIEPEKIIHILLKHLMVLKNENAYLKNKEGIYTNESGNAEINLGTNHLYNGKTEINLGTNHLYNGKTEIDLGTNQLYKAIPQNDLGTNQLYIGKTENDLGTNQLIIGKTENDLGTNQLIIGKTENDLGTNQQLEAIPNNEIALNEANEALPKMNLGANESPFNYAIFEQELIQALDRYIKNGEGKNTLFTFYTDFEAAIMQRNSDSIKRKDAAANLRLEDTHIFPPNISVEIDTIAKLQRVLRTHLPLRTNRHSYSTVAYELLHLHNAGKATSAQMGKFGGLSIIGLKKHLPKLMRYGLIKKLPPSNYILTDKAKHILLQLFGIKNS